MQITRLRDDSFEITLSEKELVVVHNALNEVVNGIEIFEFATRLGAGREEVKALLKVTSEALQ